VKRFDDGSVLLFVLIQAAIAGVGSTATPNSDGAAANNVNAGAEKSAAVIPTISSLHQKSEFKSIAPEVALKWLQHGNTRFTKGTFRKDGVSSEDRKHLTEGQHPHSIVLSCSDSQVPPEIVFDQKLGEIFAVRTAGEALDSTVIASIEYAVSHLGPQLVVVMGHTQCGAIKAAVSTINGGDAGSEHLNKLVKDIQPRIDLLKRVPASVDYLTEAWVNAKGVAADLAKRSKIIDEKIKQGQLLVVPALYHIESGKVEW
jgi:carbonic anhydrase